MAEYSSEDFAAALEAFKLTEVVLSVEDELVNSLYEYLSYSLLHNDQMDDLFIFDRAVKAIANFKKISLSEVHRIAIERG
jgi:hypothetical protein